MMRHMRNNYIEHRTSLYHYIPEFSMDFSNRRVSNRRVVITQRQHTTRQRPALYASVPPLPLFISLPLPCPSPVMSIAAAFSAAVALARRPRPPPWWTCRRACGAAMEAVRADVFHDAAGVARERGVSAADDVASAVGRPSLRSPSPSPSPSHRRQSARSSPRSRRGPPDAGRRDCRFSAGRTAGGCRARARASPLAVVEGEVLHHHVFRYSCSPRGAGEESKKKGEI